MEKLLEHFNKLLQETKTDFHRYIYSKINWNSRMIGIIGPRGVGKTTLILQYIKENLNPNTALYVTAEDFYFADHKLLDLADSYTKVGGKHLFIDEIHKYKNWSKELKLIYDYHPELKIIFTGSSILDINKGVSDLSRRAIMYQMQGLSFREYLQLFHQTSTDFSDFILFFQKSHGFVENTINKPATFRGTIVFGNLDILVQSHLHGDRGEIFQLADCRIHD